jgi:hypothetical protein
MKKKKDFIIVNILLCSSSLFISYVILSFISSNIIINIGISICIYLRDVLFISKIDYIEYLVSESKNSNNVSLFTMVELLIDYDDVLKGSIGTIVFDYGNGFYEVEFIHNGNSVILKLSSKHLKFKK